MYDKAQMEIPEAVRQVAERNVEQTRVAYNQFMDMARKAQEMVMQSQGAMAGAALEIQTRALRYAEQNMEAGFAMASEMARARDVREYLEVQQRHAQKQMQAYASQAQELGNMMSAAAQKAQPKP
jgi:phasin